MSPPKPSEATKGNRDVQHTRSDRPVVSTLFTAQNVRDHLADAKGLEAANEWCRKSGVTSVYIETYRDTYYAERDHLTDAREYFEREGYNVAGCITPTRMGKLSTGWDPISCFTSTRTQEELTEISEYTASIFDTIMVDDFLFTDCTCEECITGRGTASWKEYRSELMVDVSRRCILEPAYETNPDSEVIIKYPQWYDQFAERGYVVDEQTADFDHIWVGTETRDYDDPRWGGTPQFGAYYLMRWLDKIGGEKTGGGWFDPYGTTPDTYLEQATQTILGGADEMLLFCYGSLLENTGPANIDRFREELPSLRQLAELIADCEPLGVSIPKPPNSDPISEATIERYLGMLGIPLVPSVSVTPEDSAVVLTPPALEDPGCSNRVAALLEAGTPVALTEGIASRLADQALLEKAGIKVIPTEDDAENIYDIDPSTLDAIRAHLLEPLSIGLEAPIGVALYLFEGSENPVILDNFTDEPAEIKFRSEATYSPNLTIPADANVETEHTDNGLRIVLPERTLIALT